MNYYIKIASGDFNYTYNVAPMWYDFLKKKCIREFYGLSGRESLPVLRKLRDHMEDNAEMLIAMNPSNGWGDYYGALDFVNGLIFAAIRNLDDVWEGD